MSHRWRQRILLVVSLLILAIIIVLIVSLGHKKGDNPLVGVIFTGEIDDEGWNRAHYLGIRSACEELGAELVLKTGIPEGTGECEKAINELADKGARMIILTSYAYPLEVKDVFKKYPNIAFYGISSEYYSENMTSYFGRMYQARYLTGIVAGMKTETNRIGYVAAMSNNEVNRGINAFTLGVKSVNPDASVYVVWTESWEDKEKETEAANQLIQDEEVDIITYHQNQSYVASVADEAGVYSIGYNEAVTGLSDKYLTAAIWNWNSLYYEIVRELISGKANTVKRHWFDINTGAIQLAEYSPLIEEAIKEKIEAAKREMNNGKDVFSGLIYDNAGNMRCDAEESISDEILLKAMNWYVDGVVLYE